MISARPYLKRFWFIACSDSEMTLLLILVFEDDTKTLNFHDQTLLLRLEATTRGWPRKIITLVGSAREFKSS